MMFRGRQMAHPELGRKVLERLVEEVADVGKVESSPTMEARSMTMVLAPDQDLGTPESRAAAEEGEICRR
jgi:translation initiation factor IF-3